MSVIREQDMVDDIREAGVAGHITPIPSRCKNCDDIMQFPIVFEMSVLTREYYCPKCALGLGRRLIADAYEVETGLCLDRSTIRKRVILQYSALKWAMNLWRDRVNALS